MSRTLTQLCLLCSYLSFSCSIKLVLCLSVKSRVMTINSQLLICTCHFYLSHLFPRGGRLTIPWHVLYSLGKADQIDSLYLFYALVQFLILSPPQTRLSSLSIKIIFKRDKIVTNFERFQRANKCQHINFTVKNIKIRLKIYN